MGGAEHNGSDRYPVHKIDPGGGSKKKPGDRRSRTLSLIFHHSPEVESDPSTNSSASFTEPSDLDKVAVKIGLCGGERALYYFG